jgi:hypothetical protein
MQSINMFSTYGKLQLNFFTIPTSKNIESVLSLFGTCSEPVGNLLGTGWQDLFGLVVLAPVVTETGLCVRLTLRITEAAQNNVLLSLLLCCCCYHHYACAAAAAASAYPEAAAVASRA